MGRNKILEIKFERWHHGFESDVDKQLAYLHKAVVRGEVVPHRISPSLVVSFEEREQSADLLQYLRGERKWFEIVFILTAS